MNEPVKCANGSGGFELLALAYVQPNWTKEEIKQEVEKVAIARRCHPLNVGASLTVDPAWESFKMRYSDESRR